MCEMGIATLSETSVKSFAANIVRHSRNFMTAQMQNNIDVCTGYKIVQFLCADNILECLEHIYGSEEVEETDDDFKSFTAYLFDGKADENFSAQYGCCLNFLFNEYTSRFSLRGICQMRDIQDEIFSAFTRCKNLTRLSLQSCNITDSQFSQLLSCYQLCEVDLISSDICTDKAVSGILKNCPNLRALRASGERITDRCLLRLCGSASESFQFCPHGDACCNVGMNLVELVLLGTKITIKGIACALQHLRKLEKLLDGGLWEDDTEDRHLVPGGICELQNGSEEFYGKIITLKLTTIIFDEITWSGYCEIVKRTCPYLNKFVRCLGPLRALLTEWHEDMEISVPLYENNPSLQICWLYEITQCLGQKGIKQFGTDGRYVIISRSVNGVPEPPPTVRCLEHIRLSSLICNGELVFRFFFKVFSLAIDIKSLTISNKLAEVSFAHSLKFNPFRKLEEITFSEVDLRRIPVRLLLDGTEQLKRIILIRCKNVESFIEQARQVFRPHYFTLDIVRSNENRTCYDTIKFCRDYDDERL